MSARNLFSTSLLLPWDVQQQTTSSLLKGEPRGIMPSSPVRRMALLLIHLNSANGVWQNGARITEAKIQPGETFEIGGCVFQFVVTAPDTQPEATLINTEGELELTLNQMTVPISLNHTSLPRLVVHAPDRTWELLLTEDAYTICLDRRQPDRVGLRKGLT